MYNYTANRGNMWTIAMTIVLVFHRIGRLLMCMYMDCPSCRGVMCLFREDGDASVHTEESGARMDRAYCLGVGRPGSVPFVSHRPGAYGRLLLAVYVRWNTGLLVSSDWLRPVMRGGWI